MYPSGRDVYRGEGESQLRMDVYAPPALGRGERRPAVFFVHGGPISPALPLAPTEWGVYRGYGALAAASGWIGVTFNHRFWGYDHLETAADDIAAAVAYVREHADRLRVDADRLCLWAFSGGGPLLADALRVPVAYLRCLVAYYAVLDLRPLASAEGVTGSVAADDAAALLAHCCRGRTGDEPNPLLVARAGHDDPSLNAASDAFIQAALAANLPLDALNHPAGYHAFDVRNDDARTREILEHTLSFLHAHLDR